MKICVVLILSLFSTFKAMAHMIEEVEVPVEHIYAPKGFDSNDSVEIIIAAHLPNLCYRSPKTAVVISGKNINIDLKALHTQSETCAEMLVPITETVVIGVLPAGEYQITVNQGLTAYEKSSIIVGEAQSETVDEAVYAYIDYVEKFDDSRSVKFKIMNPSDCFRFDRVEWISNDKDTLSVLPIMKQIRTFCPLKPSPMEVKVDVPKILSKDKILLHVRSMHGGSFNTLFDNSKP